MAKIWAILYWVPILIDRYSSGVAILTDFLAQSLLRYELSENPLKIATSLGKSAKMATAERECFRASKNCFSFFVSEIHVIFPCLPNFNF